jgi:hypothetical protein
MHRPIGVVRTLGEERDLSRTRGALDTQCSNMGALHLAHDFMYSSSDDRETEAVIGARPGPLPSTLTSRTLQWSVTASSPDRLCGVIASCLEVQCAAHAQPSFEMLAIGEVVRLATMSVRACCC